MSDPNCYNRARLWSSSFVETTRATLLQRVKDRTDDTAWRDFNRMYFPLLFRYARARGLAPPDAEDVAQQTMQAVSRGIADFEYSSTRGKFRNWLRTITDHKVTDLLRKRREVLIGSALLDQSGSSSAEPDRLWELQWQKEHLRYCLERLREEVPVKSYQCFHLFALQQKPAGEVAQLLGVSENQVWVTKHRLLGRLQAMMAEFFGSEST
jgi:RNA polymerase sigma-70 factor (ECF subfamily)